MRHFLATRFFGTTRDERRQQIIQLIASALRQMTYYANKQQMPPPLDPANRVGVATIFEEGSTRTRMSSETAARRLGCYVPAGITTIESSLGKNESLEDTLSMLAQNCIWGAIVRTKTEGAGLWLAHEMQRLEGEKTWIPRGMSVIVGGEGKKVHDTQLLLDLVTIVLNELGVRDSDQAGALIPFLAKNEEEVYQRIAEILDHLRICFVGDLRLSRVVHSWIALEKIFDIEYGFIAPEEFKLERWARPTRSMVDTHLGASVEYPYIYFMRTQVERLIGTPDNPGQMTKRKALNLIKEYEVTEDYLDRCNGKLLHAQPRDQELPMIPNRFKDHPKVIMFMQSACGIPTREAVLMACYRGRYESEPLILIPRVELKPDWVTNQERWEDHVAAVRKKNEGREVIINPIENGTAIDRLEQRLIQVHDRMLADDGVYKQPTGNQILPGRNLFSREMQRNKGTLWLYGFQITPEQAAKHGLLSPRVRISHMDRARELNDGSAGYLRVEYPLPPVVEGFRCLNESCMTNRTTIARPIFSIRGTKGHETSDHFADCGLECLSCGDVYTAREIIEACYGPLILPD